jgi:hypothetical protein
LHHRWQRASDCSGPFRVTADRHDSAELVDESAVRLLVASGWADDREQAWRATQLLAGMDARRDRWRRCALNCCWLKFVPAQEDLLIQLPLP